MYVKIFWMLWVALLIPDENKVSYLDPGSGSILLQVIIAAILGALIVLRTSWGRIRSFFRRPDTEEKDQEEDAQE
ncbi:MAG TPA: hypothetical protein VJ768_10315 [Anaerolineales bacterium]|nr:hypothetical protein [Anaerolineales bacterium]